MQARVTVLADAAALDQMEQLVATFAAEHSISNEDRARICIVLEELLTNLIKFGYAGRAEPGLAEIALELDGDRLTLEFADDGAAFDPLAQPPPVLDEAGEDRPVGGLGLHILRTMADEVYYSHSAGRNLLRFTRTVSLIVRR